MYQQKQNDDDSLRTKNNTQGKCRGAADDIRYFA